MKLSEVLYQVGFLFNGVCAGYLIEKEMMASLVIMSATAMMMLAYRIKK